MGHYTERTRDEDLVLPHYEYSSLSDSINTMSNRSKNIEEISGSLSLTVGVIQNQSKEYSIENIKSSGMDTSQLNDNEG